AVVSSDHPALATMTLRTAAPIAGLQGILVTSPPGLAITGLEPLGPAATWKVASQPVPEGLKFVMFSTDGSVIPESVPNDGYLGVLRVTLGIAGAAIPAPITYLSTAALIASDPHGQSIMPCPVLRIINFGARICY